MSRAQSVLLTLIVYNISLVAIGLWASRGTSDTLDFFFGGRRLGGVPAPARATG